MTRVIGPPRSTRRRWTLLVPFVLAVVVTLLMTVGASAVNQTGAFELDGNATNNAAVAGDDWDNVCHQVTAGGFDSAGKATGALCTGATNTNGATSTAWTDSTTNLEIYTGGGTKDFNDPQNSWLWKPADTVPDKDTILHAFAARYSLTPSPATCPTLHASDPTCDVIFFGSDRFDNSGDAQLGFWFFQNKVATTNTSSGGGFAFSGHHQTGDILVISDFNNGGTTALIKVYSWQPVICAKADSGNEDSIPVGGCPAANLRLEGKASNANCATSAATSSFCGIVNTSTSLTTSPWPFKDKSGNTNFAQGEFYEAGINLSGLGFGNECFSSVLAESRSSASVSAVLKDFVLSSFSPCGASMTTTPSAGTTDATSVSPGTSVTDTATVTGTGITNPPNPTGNVTFFLCARTDTSSTATCDTGGNQVGSPVALSSTGQPQGTGVATSSAVNTAASPLAPGRYCWRATWPGDSNYTGGPYVETNASSECFVVRTIPTTTVTTPSDSSGTALSSPVSLGTSLFDKAVVTGTAAGGSPPGTINFFVCDPTQTSGAAGSETCPSPNGSALSGNPRTLVAGANNTSSVLSSPAVVANKAGVWCFRAEYTHSGSTYEDSHDSSHTECVTVSPDTTSTATTPQDSSGTNLSGSIAVGTQVKDHAVVTGTTAGGTPNGTVSFFLCSPAQITGSGSSAHCVSPNGTADSANPITATAVSGSSTKTEATSSAFTANAVGTWCFRAVFTPTAGGNYSGTSTDDTNGECFLVTDSTSATSSQSWVPNDSGTVAATGGTALNGTLSIQLYEGGGCASATAVAAGATAVAGQVYSKTLTNATTAADRTLTTSNTTYTVTAGKTVAWLVTFTPSAGSNVSGSTHCETSTLTVNNN
jgi:hypothetical protein